MIAAVMGRWSIYTNCNADTQIWYVFYHYPQIVVRVLPGMPAGWQQHNHGWLFSMRMIFGTLKNWKLNGNG